ncbi:MAG: T9SS type A sorting domain-containing protein [Chloroherpetonaceae bacterium]|nr:T9SS type A sorting domain-containing protein [Chloroherpetonaceae bacterium]
MRKLTTLVALLTLMSAGAIGQTIRPMTQLKQTNPDSLARWFNATPLAPYFTNNYGDTVTVIGQVIWAANQSFDVTSGADASRALIYIADTARVQGNKLRNFGAIQVYDLVGAAGNRDSSLFNVPRGEVIKLTARIRSAFGSPLGYHHTIELDKINFTSLDLDNPILNPLPLPDTLEIPLDSLFYPDGNMDMRAEKYDGMIVRITGPLTAVVPSQSIGTNGRYPEWYVTKPLATSLTGVLALPIGDNSKFFRGTAGGGVANPDPLPPNGATLLSITGILSKVRSSGTLVVDTWNPPPSGARGRTWRLHPFRSSDIRLAPALPPVIASVVRNVTVPQPNQPVTITTRVSMPNPGDTVRTVQVFYNTTTTLPDRNFGGPYVSVNATRSATNDSIWTAQIPGFPLGTFVNYFVRATGSNNLSVLDRDTSQAKNFYRVANAPGIFDVQFSPYDNPATSEVASPLLNQTITVRGTVTSDSLDNLAEPPTNAPKAIHIQDGRGVFSGVRVVVDGYVTSAGQIVRNDSVQVTGVVRESFGYTQIDARQSAGGSIAKIGTATTPIAPLLLTTDTLRVLSERFEGMLVQVNNVEVTRARLAGQEFAIRQVGSASTNDYLVDDLSGWAFRGGGASTPVNPQADTVRVGDRFGMLRGIHFFSFSQYKLTPRRTGDFSGYVFTSEPVNPTPKRYALAQNYPNPFNPITMIRYELPERADVTLKVYDLLGREVATLVSATQGQGTYQVPFNASNLASGIYFYRLKAGAFVETKKMMLVK